MANRTTTKNVHAKDAPAKPVGTRRAARQPLPRGLLRKLEARREELCLSQEKFAVTVLGVSYSTYQRWLNRRFNPDMATLMRLRSVIPEDADSLLLALTGEASPLLAELWDNPEDAVYDEL